MIPTRASACKGKSACKGQGFTAATTSLECQQEGGKGPLMGRKLIPNGYP